MAGAVRNNSDTEGLAKILSSLMRARDSSRNVSVKVLSLVIACIWSGKLLLAQASRKGTEKDESVIKGGEGMTRKAVVRMRATGI
jgi:hypothetical protein